MSEIIAAIIGAIFTVLAVFIAYWLSSRQAHVDRLTTKLEDLQIALSESRTANDGRFRKAREMVLSPPAPTADPTEYVYLSRDMPLERRVTIYVDTYFQTLRSRRKELLEQNIPWVDIFHRFSEGKPVRIAEVLSAHLGTRDAIDGFEAKLLHCRADLVKGRHAAIADEAT
ncbi:hypothetical protein [Variovorax sp. WS11]|uniref:hypothetical protein n=1 Tax=Variovorax sp. WS11 TaxID=1105204 RepID=UPI0011B26F65|nr:hypothetical protein [Variovorax sp. WS11]NDZ18045.1 hypothetical protein [Variovorax sp. WS11]